MLRVVVLGAAGQLGREAVRALGARGHAVRAVVRRPPVAAFDSAVEVRLADARNKTDICAAISGCDAVVNTIGPGTLRRNDVESSTTAIAVSAAQEVGVQRYIAMSAGMVALDWWVFKYILRPLIFRNIVAEHCRVEEIVKASALNWTIVRPPKLTNGLPRGYLAALELQPRFFSAARADVAAFIAEELESNTYVRQAVFIVSRRTP
jgi:uncharacterized protein YbjT (DUF2867 family)